MCAVKGDPLYPGTIFKEFHRIEQVDQGVSLSWTLQNFEGGDTPTSDHNTTDENSKWMLQDFECGKILGQGGFGKVYLARERRSKCWVALKALKNGKDNKYIQQIREEIGIHKFVCDQDVSHKVVEIYGCYQDKEHIYLALEYVPGGSLRDVLNYQVKLPKETVARIIKQVCEALEFLHSINVIHRDIKPENVLIGSSKTIMLADFGIAAWTYGPRSPQQHNLLSPLLFAG